MSADIGQCQKHPDIQNNHKRTEMSIKRLKPTQRDAKWSYIHWNTHKTITNRPKTTRWEKTKRHKMTRCWMLCISFSLCVLCTSSGGAHCLIISALQKPPYYCELFPPSGYSLLVTVAWFFKIKAYSLVLFHTEGSSYFKHGLQLRNKVNTRQTDLTPSNTTLWQL